MLTMHATPPRKLVFRRVAEQALLIDMFEPTPAAATPTAAIVFFHGGGWRNGAPRQFHPQCRHLARRGLRAFSVDYRLISDSQTRVTDCVADARAAVRFVRAHADRFNVDPKRIAVAGGSAGGHLAAATTLLTGPDAPDDDPAVPCHADALVLFNPVIDTAPGGYGCGLIGKYCLQLSPAHHVRPGLPPTLYFNGEDDTTTRIEPARYFQREMTRLGNRCELVTYPNAGHGFYNAGPAHQETLARTDHFLTDLGLLPPQPAA